MWGMLLGASLILVGVFVGYALAERGQDRRDGRML